MPRTPTTVETWERERSRLGSGDPQLGGGLGRFDAGLDAELGVDGGEVVADRLRRQIEPLGDLGVAQSCSNQGQHLGFALGQAGRMSASRGPRTAAESWQVVDTEGAQTTMARVMAGFAPSSSKIAIARRTRAGSSLSARALASS